MGTPATFWRVRWQVGSFDGGVAMEGVIAVAAPVALVAEVVTTAAARPGFESPFRQVTAPSERLELEETTR